MHMHIHTYTYTYTCTYTYKVYVKVTSEESMLDESALSIFYEEIAWPAESGLQPQPLGTLLNRTFI